MSRSSFKKLLRDSEKKEAPQAHKPWEDSSSQPHAEDSIRADICETTGAHGVQRVKEPVEIYTDASVCRVLGIRRRTLAEARTAASKGRSWDSLNEEVGMTKAWVHEYAMAHGICPDFFNGGLEKVSGDYVSVRLVGTTPNHGLVQVELEATGKREFARTRNIMQYPIHYLEVFSCVRIRLPADEHLEWVARPNEVKY